MTGLPQGWAKTTLGEILYFQYGKSLSSEKRVGGGVAVYGSNGIVGRHNEAITASPTLVIGRKGSIGEVHFSESGCFPIDTTYFVDRFDAVDPRFALAILQVLPIKQMNRASAIPGLNREEAHSLQIPLPPLPEQRRIVRKLDTLSARSTTARTHLTAIEKLVERYRRAVTERLFEELLAEHGEQELGELCERVTKGASPNWQGFEYATEGIVFVRSQNVLWGALDLSDTAFLPPAFNDKQRNSVIRENDVLLNIVGASIGRSAVATRAISGANCNQAVAVIRLKTPTPSDARYLSQWLTSPAAQAQITENAVDVARANFSLGQAKQLKLPWPPEEVRLETLAKIETAFAKIDRLAAEAAKALKLLGHLDQRILAKAFAGDLVPQDPTDEPAETLLARIRDARAAAPKAGRGRKAKT